MYWCWLMDRRYDESSPCHVYPHDIPNIAVVVFIMCLHHLMSTSCMATLMFWIKYELAFKARTMNFFVLLIATLYLGIGFIRATATSTDFIMRFETTCTKRMNFVAIASSVSVTVGRVAQQHATARGTYLADKLLHSFLSILRSCFTTTLL